MYIYIYIPYNTHSTQVLKLKHGGPPADGRHPGGRWTPRRAADRRALYYGLACMLALWGKGGGRDDASTCCVALTTTLTAHCTHPAPIFPRLLHSRLYLSCVHIGYPSGVLCAQYPSTRP